MVDLDKKTEIITKIADLRFQISQLYDELDKLYGFYR